MFLDKKKFISKYLIESYYVWRGDITPIFKLYYTWYRRYSREEICVIIFYYVSKDSACVMVLIAFYFSVISLYNIISWA